jgi:signal transduction histidine kinase
MLATLAAVAGLTHPAHLDDPEARAAFATAMALTALASAALLFTCFEYTRERRDLLLLSAVAVLAIGDVLFSLIPAAATAESPSLGSGTQVGGGLLVAFAFLVVALSPGGLVKGDARKLASWGVGAGGAAVLVAWAVARAAEAKTSSKMLEHVGLGAGAKHPFLLALIGLSALVFLLAAVAYSWRARRGEGQAGVLAGVCALLAAGTLQYSVLPVVESGWLTAADVLQSAAFILLLLVAATRHRAVRRALTAAAASAERQRIARDLHDGLAQDLAFIAVQSQRLNVEEGSGEALAVAARRALEVTRAAIVDLSAVKAPSTERALRAVADELEMRHSVRIVVSAEGGSQSAGDLAPPTREAVVRIAREAIVNAIRHGRATHVSVVLNLDGRGPLVRVSDNGGGIGCALSETHPAFGVSTMRARAESIGGRLVTVSGAHGGTDVMVDVSSRPRARRVRRA